MISMVIFGLQYLHDITRMHLQQGQDFLIVLLIFDELWAQTLRFQ